MTDNATTPYESVWIPDGLEARVEVMKERLHSEGYNALNNLRVAVAYARIAFHNKDTEWECCSACNSFTRVYGYTQDRRTELDKNADLWVMNSEYSFCYSCVVRKAQSRTCNRDEVTGFQYDDYEQACNVRIGQAFTQESMPEATQPEPNRCPCGNHIHPQDMVLGLNHSGVEVEAHSDCVKHCEECNKNIISYGNASFRRIDGRWLCGSCSDTAIESGDYTNCERCEEYFHTDDISWSDARERNLCSRCYNNPVTCRECDYNYTEGSSHECWRGEGETIYSYSYKPKAKFFGQGKYHLGFELEVEESDGNPDDRDYTASLIVDKLGERVYMKYDGSLDYGFEVVTHPHTLEEYKDTAFDWSFLSTLVSRNFVSWNNSNCGFHIHISKSAFDTTAGYQAETAHKMRFTKFIYDNQYQVERIAGRKSNEFATFTDKGKILNKVLHDDQSNGRYEVVNVYNEDTYEIRIFKGSLRKERLLSNLEFIHAVCEYTRNMKVVAKHTPFAWSRFIKYVTDNDTRYPSLMLLINEAFSQERIKSEV